jgi:plastocyanin
VLTAGTAGVSDQIDEVSRVKTVGLSLLLVLCLLACPLALAKPRDKDKGKKDAVREHKVEISDVKYKPAKLKIKKGEKVVWTNADDRDHTVVSHDKAKTLDSGKIGVGQTWEYTFDKPGTYEYGCEYHPRMKGVIEVSE